MKGVSEGEWDTRHEVCTVDSYGTVSVRYSPYASAAVPTGFVVHTLSLLFIQMMYFKEDQLIVLWRRRSGNGCALRRRLQIQVRTWQDRTRRSTQRRAHNN